MDVQEQIGAVTRAWRRDERDGETVHVQTLSQLYPSPLNDVWDAVTTSSGSPRWFLPITGDLEVGGRYQFEGNAGEVLECEAPADGRARYVVTWEMGGVTWVTVRLLAEGDSSTRFELEHVAREADVPAEMSAMFGPGATGVGWDGGLLGLWLHLTRSGGSMSPADLAAWVATDEGKAFYRGAADAWAQASIEAGTPEEQARQQADATYGFYTGS